jgi:hypothetical protein
MRSVRVVGQINGIGKVLMLLALGGCIPVSARRQRPV